jgi:DhnA family fructose-bisphosphate aldolase class Ia
MVGATGKKVRLNRLQNQYGFCFLLAADHQLSSGRIPELGDLSPLIDLVDRSPGLSGIVLNVGSLRRVPSTFRKEVVPQLMGGPNPAGNNISKKQVGSVLEAVRMGANMISTQINFEEVSFLDQIDCFRRIRQQADNFGILILAMINLKDRSAFDMDRFCNYLAYASELGADLLKINLPVDAASSAEQLKDILSHLPPVLLSGDAKESHFPDTVRLSKACGFRGLCVGRNIFKHHNPDEIVGEVCDIFKTAS